MSRTGAERSDVEPIWPAGLRRSATKLIYLDLNQWIALAKADTGHPEGADFQLALERLRALPSGFSCVIGLPLIMEITGNRRRRQLADLAELIEELTDFACLMPLTTIVPLELESAIASIAPIDVKFEPIPLVGQGVLQAMGKRGGVRVRDQKGNDVTERARLESPAGPEAFDRRLFEAERELDRSVLRGPTNDEEEQELVADGWDPSAMRKVAENRARQEREFADLLATDPKWRRGRLRDVIAARYLALEFREVLDRAQVANGFRVADLFPEIDQARHFVDSMPAADAWITLRTAKHRNPDSKWLPNDIFDIDALAAAAPYCDVVVTERHSAHVLRQGHIPENYGTAIFSNLDELVEHLDESA